MTEAAPKNASRDRSPAFPAIALEPALSRLSEFENHFKRSPARPEKVGDAWNVKNKAQVDRLAAALKYYGLLDYEGTGKGRHVVVSETGRKYLRAQQEETKREIVKAAALHPKQIAKFWSLWGLNRPADPVCLDDLVLGNDFSGSGARDFLRVYDATIRFAGLKESDKVEPSEPGDEDAGEEESDNSPLPRPAPVKIGDYVQWASSGGDQFTSPRRVVWISEDGSYVRVHGETIGIPMNQLAATDPSKPTLDPVTASSAYGADNSTSKSDVSVLLRGKRLEITADVDADGLANLQEMLTKYAEILKLVK